MEGALGTRPLVWLPEDTEQIVFQDLLDPYEGSAVTLGLRKVDPAPAVAGSVGGDAAFRLPQLPTDGLNQSGLSLQLFFDSESGELSLSFETWLDLWSATRYDGSANEQWATRNRDWMLQLIREVAQEVGGELEITNPED